MEHIKIFTSLLGNTCNLKGISHEQEDNGKN